MACSRRQPVQRQSIDERHADAVLEDGLDAGHRLATCGQRELVGREHQDGQGLAVERLGKRQDLGDGRVARAAPSSPPPVTVSRVHARRSVIS